MRTLKEWLSAHGKEPCDTCQYFNFHKCKCTYKAGYCVRYDNYKREEKAKAKAQKEYPDLFESINP